MTILVCAPAERPGPQVCQHEFRPGEAYSRIQAPPPPPRPPELPARCVRRIPWPARRRSGVTHSRGAP
jgi:hypothetical protein